MDRTAAADIGRDALELLRTLLRIDTSNPPGNERPCAEVLVEYLTRHGYEPKLLEKAPGRTNLVVRRAGSGSAGGPLMLTGHMDVVPAEGGGWRFPPFAAQIDDGFLYGRGAIDMKNHLAASAAVLGALAREGRTLQRDLIFTAVADEERGGIFGARYLVSEHPELVRAEWALGELGAFTLFIAGKRLYPIQVAQKGAAWFSLRATGASGHGSMPLEQNALLALSRAVSRVTPRMLPVRITPPVRAMLRRLGRALGGRERLFFSLLECPWLVDRILPFLPDPGTRRALGAVLRDTLTPTVFHAGSSTNVIEAEAHAELDGRFLPGETSEGLRRAIEDCLDRRMVRLEMIGEQPAVEAPVDSPLYCQLERAIVEMDPEGIPFPSVTPGYTDAAAFSTLGTRWYGFTPFVLPDRPRLSMTELYHAPDERIPVEGFQRGAVALYRAVVGYCGTSTSGRSGSRPNS